MTEITLTKTDYDHIRKLARADWLNGHGMAEGSLTDSDLIAIDDYAAWLSVDFENGTFPTFWR